MFAPRKVLSVLAGVSLLAMASASYGLAIGDANYVGSVSPGGGDPATEAGYINALILLAPGAGDTPCVGQTCNRENSVIPTAALPSATSAGKQDNGNTSVDLGAGFFQYILGKYDAQNAGSLVWFSEAGFTGIITLPGSFGQQGLSHTTWFNSVPGGDDDDQDVPEPGTLALLGLGLLGLGLGRRRRNG